MIIEGVEEDAFLASRRASSCPLKGMFLDVERLFLHLVEHVLDMKEAKKVDIKSEESVFILGPSSNEEGAMTVLPSHILCIYLAFYFLLFIVQ